MGTAVTALHAALQELLNRFAKDVVSSMYKKGAIGAFEWPIQDFTIRIDIIDGGPPNRVPFVLLHDGILTEYNGTFEILESPVATFSGWSSSGLITEFLNSLSVMFVRGELGEIAPKAQYNLKPEDVGAFKTLLEKFNRTVLSPARQAHPSGKYQWPLGDYTLEVDFPESVEVATIPFTIFRDKSGSLSRGLFNTNTWEVTDLVCPQLEHVSNIFFSLSPMVVTSEPMSGSQETRAGTEPPMIVITNNTPDISDEWVKWFCERNPGTSYAKAIHAAITHMNAEARKLKTITDRYANRS